MPRAPKAFREIPDKFLLCRGITHPWDLDPDWPYIEVVEKEDIRWRTIHVKCLRCEATKVLYWAADGERRRRGNTPRYPDGYLVEGLSDWGGRGELLRNARKELVARLANGATPPKKRHKRTVRGASRG